ncbi:endo alpha-1,4 polygalactosaminidase [Microbacterium sp. PA5]|uniref:endo alpha-1,4 polygalactosaminidase n=1 Tax=Microbacterium sp. PA5 TaxID=3416654 RepID=UPI003CF1820A
MSRHVHASVASRGIRALVAVAAALALAGCAMGPAPRATPDGTPAGTPAGTPEGAPAPSSSAVLIASPPVAGAPDYQLGGAYEPATEVQIVARDRTDPPVGRLYSICYVNAFQTQPGEAADWPADLLLRDAAGEFVVDPDWPDEVIVDTRDAEAVAAVVSPWIEGCARDGFDAVEFDNLDTYTRTDGALSREDNLAVAGLLVRAAHRAGLAAGQKNAAEDAALLRSEAAFDFAVTEECAAYDECSAYTDVYGDAVIGIEYTDNLPAPFAEVCASPERPASLVLRDRDLTVPGDPAYVFELCH